MYKIKRFSKSDYEGLSPEESKKLKKYRGKLAKDLNYNRNEINKYSTNPSEEVNKIKGAWLGQSKSLAEKFKRKLINNRGVKPFNLSNGLLVKKLPKIPGEKVINTEGVTNLPKLSLGLSGPIGPAKSANPNISNKDDKSE